jgi:nicotinate phosphoribosyltransferase
MIKSLKDIIITDPTDQDVYKFSMQNFLFKKDLLHERVEFQLFNRGKTEFPTGFAEALRYQVDAFGELRFKDYMIDHILKSMPWLNREYVECYLRNFRYEPTTVHINQNGPTLSLICDGEYGKIIPWETQIMPVMSELLSFMTDVPNHPDLLSYEEITNRNIEKFKEFERLKIKVADFGTRRRFSKDNHYHMLEDFRDYAPNCITGTSNLMFAREFNLKPIGTIAHELPMFYAAKYGVLSANRMVMKDWVDVYQGSLGIMLPDTFTTDFFLKDFDLMYAKLFDGLREDSALNLYDYTDKIIDFYEEKNIDSSTKTIVHSNNINSIELLENINPYRANEIRKSYGIGTWLTHDVYRKGGVLKPVNWVIKLTAIYTNKGKQYTVKTGDDPMKITSVDLSTVDIYKHMLKIA